MTSSLKETKMLKFNTNTLHDVRKEHNLDQPGQMEQAIDILQQWIQKQNHFMKKDFRREYLERVIISSKGSIERAKQRIDKYCTMRTMAPEYFDKFDAKADFPKAGSINVDLPLLTEENYRIHITTMKGSITPATVNDFYKFNAILCEYMKLYDYASGVHIISDVRDVNIMEFLASVNPLGVRNFLKIYTDAWGFRIKGFYIISAAKSISVFVSIVKQAVSAKVGQRIRLLQTPEELYEYVPKHLLPEDYGGDQKPLAALYDEWVEELSKEEHIAYVKEMSRARTDEELRLSDEYKEECQGVPGSFRVLHID